MAAVPARVTYPTVTGGMPAVSFFVSEKERLSEIWIPEVIRSLFQKCSDKYSQDFKKTVRLPRHDAYRQ